MPELAGKTAFVTGGGSGIGFALGRTFAEAGMKVMLADIETDALAAAVKSLRDFRRNMQGVACDVGDPLSVEYAAEASYEAFGNVHVVCNNAGVAAAAVLTTSCSAICDGCSTSTLWGSFTASVSFFRISAPTAKAATSSAPRPWQGW